MGDFPFNAVNETAIFFAGTVVGKMRRRILDGVDSQIGPHMRAGSGRGRMLQPSAVSHELKCRL